jgi:hypothetical protein
VYERILYITVLYNILYYKNLIFVGACGGPGSLTVIFQYYSGDQIEDEMGMACSTHGKDEKFNILIGKCEGKRPL